MITIDLTSWWIPIIITVIFLIGLWFLSEVLEARDSVVFSWLEFGFIVVIIVWALYIGVNVGRNFPLPESPR